MKQYLCSQLAAAESQRTPWMALGTNGAHTDLLRTPQGLLTIVPTDMDGAHPSHRSSAVHSPQPVTRCTQLSGGSLSPERFCSLHTQVHMQRKEKMTLVLTVVSSTIWCSPDAQQAFLLTWLSSALFSDFVTPGFSDQKKRRACVHCATVLGPARGHRARHTRYSNTQLTKSLGKS